MAIGPAGSSPTQSDRRRLGSVTLARSRVRVRAGYKFVSCRRHGDQRLPAGPIATSLVECLTYEILTMKRLCGFFDLSGSRWTALPPPTIGPLY